MDPYASSYSKRCVAMFVKRMNQEAVKLNMKSSSFSNPHGLSDKANKSSANDMIKLTQNAIRLPLFREITNIYHHVSTSVFDWHTNQTPERRGCLVSQ